MRWSVVPLSIALVGCTNSPLFRDNNLGTLALPDDTTCQLRRFEGSGGGGVGASATGSMKAVTLHGPDSCKTKEMIEALNDALR